MRYVIEWFVFRESGAELFRPFSLCFLFSPCSDANQNGGQKKRVFKVYYESSWEFL
jgi:hypothetical protein